MSSSSDINTPLPADFEAQLLKGLVKYLLELVTQASAKDETKKISAAEIAQIRMLCSDNSVSFASIKRGDFGKVAQAAAEEFPFDAQSGRSLQ